MSPCLHPPPQLLVDDSKVLDVGAKPLGYTLRADAELDRDYRLALCKC